MQRAPYGITAPAVTRATAAADAEFAIRFDGKADDGTTLAPGRYPVVYWLGSAAAAYGVLTTVDWQG